MENTDWSALGFDYRKTDYNVRYSFADGKWSDMVVTDDEYIQMHMSASCLHYGIELFEGQGLPRCRRKSASFPRCRQCAASPVLGETLVLAGSFD